MSLTDWIVALAIAVPTILFSATRKPLHWSSGNRTRHAAGVRLLVQAAVSVWGSLMIVGHELLHTHGWLAAHCSARTLVMAALVLLGCGGWWTFRASRLLRARRIFAARRLR